MKVARLTVYPVNPFELLFNPDYLLIFNSFIYLQMQKSTFTLTERLLAWSVHALTASGVIVAFLSIVAIAEERWTMAMWWLIVSLIIDGIDGTMARKFRVKEVLPHFEGGTVDNIIDFATYALIPAYFMYAYHIDGQYLLPNDEWIRTGITAVVLLTSVFYYGKKGMVSSDNHFVGFPVMWNLVAYYSIFVFGFGQWGNFWLLIFFCVLHFVPIKFLYPSRTKQLYLLTVGIVISFLVSNFALLYTYPDGHMVWKSIAIFTLVYFAMMGIYKTFFWKEGTE